MNKYKIISLMAFLFILICQNLMAEVDPIKAQMCLIGEASNQGAIGMQAVAEVIRRRDSLKGFYGAKRDKFIDSQPKWVHEQAKKAWQASESSDITHGATHFENVKAFGAPKWAKKMKKTAVVGDHVFFKEVSKK